MAAVAAFASVSQAATRFAVQDATGTINKMVVTDTGAIGVGVTVPTAGVHLKSGTFPYNIFKSEGNETSSGGGFIAYHVKSDGTLPLSGDRLGYVLFGSMKDGNVLHSSGITAKADGDWTDTGIPTAVIFEASGASGLGRLERMRISSNGNIGIGTTNPLYKLQVMGSVASNTTVLTSDGKFKKNVQDIKSPLDAVLNLKGRSYEWKTDEFRDRNLPEGRHYGVIAQEIEQVMPEVVYTAEDGTKGVAYNEIIPVLIEAIKAQQKRIEALEMK